MNPEMNISMLPTVTMLLMLIGLIFAVLSDHYIKRAHRIIMLIIASLVILLVVQNVSEFMLENYYVHPIARTMNSIIGYSIRPLILLLFFYIVDESQTATAETDAGRAGVKHHITAKRLLHLSMRQPLLKRIVCPGMAARVQPEIQAVAFFTVLR